jgi:hypothetical protein
VSGKDEVISFLNVDNCYYCWGSNIRSRFRYLHWGENETGIFSICIKVCLIVAH